MKEDIFESSERFAVLQRLASPLSRRGMIELSKRRPKSYLALCVFLALSAYIFLLGVPLLLLTQPIVIYTALQSVSSSEDWYFVGLDVFLLMFGVFTTIAIGKLRFSLPTGLELKRDKFPQFYELLDEVQDHYQTRFLRIDRVILRDSFDISLIKTPRFGLPFVFTNTLVVGLPVLQTMKPHYFRALLTRKIGQASLRENLLTGWLTQLSSVWPQYVREARKAGFIGLPLFLFFKAYSGLYQFVLFGIFRKDELKADLSALDLINDHDVMEVIGYEMLTRNFINHRYFPKIYQMAGRTNKPDILPYANIAEVVRNSLKMETYRKSIEAAMHEEDEHLSQYPSFYERIHNLGHHKPCLPGSPLGDTAAEQYLGKRLAMIVDKFDKIWLSNTRKTKK